MSWTKTLSIRARSQDRNNGDDASYTELYNGKHFPLTGIVALLRPFFLRKVSSKYTTTVSVCVSSKGALNLLPKNRVEVEENPKCFG